ncbi:helix-turn-helix transcriptional regulator [Niallia sp. FSL R7-0271]|uniref:helix-turn-helix transcriptional regulator n=1 Tax=Niallia sp. FSL R7-0271 TaxID=2921678 RepID=UPI0030F96355
MENNNSIKINLGEIIKESPYKREYIQKHMEISRNTLSNWCTGRTYPSIPQAFKLSRILGVTVEDLYKWKDDK